MIEYSLNSSLLSNGISDRSSSVDAFDALSPGTDLSTIETPSPRRNVDSRCHIVHLNAEHVIYGCCECKEHFLEPPALEQHLRDAHPWLRSTFFCPDCGQRFLHSGHVGRHRRELHRPERTHECDLCGKRFKRGEHLRGHERASHGRVRDFACALCGRTFARRAHAQRHERQVHRRDPSDLVCRYCRKSFSRTSSLARHQKVCAEMKVNEVPVAVEPTVVVPSGEEDVDDWIELLVMQ